MIVTIYNKNGIELIFLIMLIKCNWIEIDLICVYICRNVSGVRSVMSVYVSMRVKSVL